MRFTLLIALFGLAVIAVSDAKKREPCTKGAQRVNGKCQCKGQLIMEKGKCIKPCPKGAKMSGGECVCKNKKSVIKDGKCVKKRCGSGAELVKGECQCKKQLVMDKDGNCVRKDKPDKVKPDNCKDNGGGDGGNGATVGGGGIYSGGGYGGLQDCPRKSIEYGAFCTCPNAHFIHVINGATCPQENCGNNEVWDAGDDTDDEGKCTCPLDTEKIDGKCLNFGTTMCVHHQRKCTASNRPTKTLKPQTLKQCHDACNSDGACQYFHWVRSGVSGFCNLFNTACGPSSHHIGDKSMVMGYKSNGMPCESMIKWKYCRRYRIRCDNGMIQSTRVQNLRSCFDLCALRADCKSVTLIQTNQKTERDQICSMRNHICPQETTNYYEFVIDYVKIPPTGNCDAYEPKGKMCLKYMEHSCHAQTSIRSTSPTRHGLAGCLYNCRLNPKCKIAVFRTSGQCYFYETCKPTRNYGYGYQMFYKSDDEKAKCAAPIM